MPCLGIAGRMEVTTSPKVGITALRVTPDVRTKTVVVSATIHNGYAGEGTGWVNIEAVSFNTPAPRKAPPLRAEIPIGMGTTTCELVYPLGEEAQLWTPARPVLHRLKFWLGGTIVDRPVDDDGEIVFGLRSLQPVLAPASFSLPMARWQLNGEPVLLASRPAYPAFPPAVCPPTEVAAWRAIWAGLRRDGASHAFFPGWCPPEAAFRAADEAGILLTPAAGGWPDANRTRPAALPFRPSSQPRATGLPPALRGAPPAAGKSIPKSACSCPARCYIAFTFVAAIGNGGRLFCFVETQHPE
jgi:hypothetical protein